MSATALAEQRKIVTILFADLSGSTVLGEKLDAEDLRGVLGAYFAALARQIQRYEGTIDKYIGDAIMAVFGAPLSHEDDAERALHAAIAMQAAIQRLNDDLERGHGVRLALRIGVNTGEVVAGMLAGDVQKAYTVVGDAVNTAQRFESAAPLNEVLVSESTYRLAVATFEFERLAPLTLKGKSQPVPTYRLLRRRDEEVPPEASPLVGREAELARLREELATAREGTGRILHVSGEAGVGKSRLLSEFRRVLGSDVWRIAVRSASYETNTPYAVLANLLRSAWRIRETDDDRTTSFAITQGFMRFREPLEEGTHALLMEVLGFGERSQLEPERKQAALVDIVRRLLRRASAVATIVITAEDMQWIDPASTSALGAIVAEIGGLRALFLSTGRPGWIPAWPTATIELAPLSSEDTHALISEILEGQATDAVASEIASRAGGNPFFIEELSRQFKAGAISGELPQSIQEVLEARLERLPEGPARVARDAAVIGQTFAYRILERLLPDEPLGVYLALLEQEAFVTPRAIQPERTFAFRQGLIREVAYQTQLLTRRRHAHALVGAAIEDAYAGRLDEFVDALAYHYGRGDDDRKAAQFLLRAGQRAQRLFAKDEALSYYRAALERSATDAALRAAAYEGMGDVQRFAATYGDALASYAKASETVGADAHLARSRLMRKTGAIHILRGDPTSALATLADALTRLPAEATGERARILLQIGEIRWREGRYADAIASLEEAVADAERARDEGAQAEALKQLGTVHVVSGEKQRGLDFYQRSLALYGAVADVAGQATVLNNTGIALQRLGRYAEALEAYGRSLEMRERIGDPLGIAQTRNNRAEILRLRGDLDGAAADHRAALELWQSIGYASVGLARSSLGIVEVERGNAEAARAFLFAAIEELQRAGNRTYLLDPQRHLARAYLIDDPDKALDWAERALAAARELRSIEREGFALQVLGLVHEARGDRDGAIAALESARGILEKTADRHETARTLAALARLYRALPVGDARRAQADALEQEARNVFTELGAALDLRRLDAAATR